MFGFTVKHTTSMRIPRKANHPFGDMCHVASCASCRATAGGYFPQEAALVSARKTSKPRAKQNVTAIIAFSNQSLITVASDSQMSYGSDSFKQSGTKKLFKIQCGDQWALLANAGSIDVGSLFREAFETKAKALVAEHERSIADAAASVLKEVRDKMLTAYHHESFEPGSGRQYLQHRESKFILAYFFGEKPLIYTLDLEAAIAVRSLHLFETIGSASNVASLILSSVDLSRLPMEQSLGVAVYTIEMCKRHDSFCGGDTQVAWLVPGPRGGLVPHFFDSHILETYLRAVRQTEEEMRGTLTERFLKGFMQLREQEMNAKERQ